MTITVAAETETKEQEKYQQHIIVTKCPAEPCAIFYTDTLLSSILIECRDAKHATQNENQGEAGREGKATTATHNLTRHRKDTTGATKNNNAGALGILNDYY
jgi:hypothetical protein